MPIIKASIIFPFLISIAISFIFSRQENPAPSNLNYMRYLRAKKAGLHSSVSDFEFRSKVFSENSLQIDRLTKSNPTADFGPTKFVDLTPEEFQATFASNQNPEQKDEESIPQVEEMAPIPTWKSARRVNWVEKGKVRPPRNQMGCGCAYAFSAVSAVEAAFAIKHNAEPPDISHQILVNCGESLYYDIHGCRGGYTTEAFKFFKDFGFFSAEDVPYKADEYPCSLNYRQIGELKDFRVVGARVEDLIAAIEDAPVAVSLEMTASFQFYTGGVIDIKAPCGFYLNHSALAVGYDLDAETPYILFQNSFGEDWGEKGYFRFAIGQSSVNGMCGIASLNNSQPIV